MYTDAVRCIPGNLLESCPPTWVLEFVLESAMQSHSELLLLQVRAWQAARPVRRCEEMMNCVGR
jgi:hypothetical protein